MGGLARGPKQLPSLLHSHARLRMQGFPGTCKDPQPSVLVTRQPRTGKWPNLGARRPRRDANASMQPCRQQGRAQRLILFARGGFSLHVLSSCVVTEKAQRFSWSRRPWSRPAPLSRCQPRRPAHPPPGPPRSLPHSIQGRGSRHRPVKDLSLPLSLAFRAPLSPTSRRLGGDVPPGEETASAELAGLSRLGRGPDLVVP